MSLKDSLIQKLETQTERWSKEVESLRADAEKKKASAQDEQAEAEIQKEFSEKIQGVEDQIATARSKLDELKGASESQLESLKQRIESWLPGSK
ncbi:hypothetical protein QVZ43_01990 [Marinobacter sp. chi1]|uniref:Coiled coil domain-containing protein n=1 Tax=Marinobacter suaedae TaxID=3057675 RepID=A0ABT8VWV7_9GAMM|nr:hypothetical protein [Marinobacter sp. chi1]MDO3720472.1 hypothetical protein [Marinobacter sp. chi1]